MNKWKAQVGTGSPRSTVLVICSLRLCGCLSCATPQMSARSTRIRSRRGPSTFVTFVLQIDVGETQSSICADQTESHCTSSAKAAADSSTRLSRCSPR